MSGLPPPVPSKAPSHHISTSSLRPNNNNTNNIDDLAASIRDSVRISSPSLEKQQQQQLAPPIIRRTPSPNLQNRAGATQSLVDTGMMSGLSGQPQLPSQRMATVNRNPFEEDEIEPVGPIRQSHARKGSLGPEGVGSVQASRAKFARAQTGLR
jgi:hypothetical protein